MDSNPAGPTPNGELPTPQEQPAADVQQQPHEAPVADLPPAARPNTGVPPYQSPDAPAAEDASESGFYYSQTSVQSLPPTAAPPSSQPSEEQALYADALTADDGRFVPGQSSDGSVSWTASDLIAHEKSANWYLALTGATALLAVIVYFITKDKLSVGIVLFTGIAFGVYAGRRPQSVSYTLDPSGITIGQRYYSFHQFRSFYVTDEAGNASASFMPLKRFGQLITIYFTPRQEDQVMAILSNSLPMELPRRDAIDSLIRRIRF